MMIRRDACVLVAQYGDVQDGQAEGDCFSIWKTRPS